jgi:hypothetical protein
MRNLVSLEGVASRSPHGVLCVTNFLHIVLLCELSWIDM